MPLNLYIDTFFRTFVFILFLINLQVFSQIEVPIRIGAFNVAVGEFGYAVDIGDELTQYDLDILGLNECPQLIDPNSNLPEWIEIVADILDMPYYEIGTISSGNHWQNNWGTDISGNYHGKLRAILSKGPITNMEDIALTGSGWRGASVFRGETEINGVKLAFYSLHVPGANDSVSGSTHEDIANRVIPNETMENYVMAGDFNDGTNDATMQYLEEKGMRFTWDDINNQPNVGIDHILYNVSSGAHATEGGRFDPDLSDHPYVWSEIVYTIPVVPIVKSDNQKLNYLHIKSPHNNQLKFYLARKGHYSLSLYTIQGKTKITLSQGRAASGWKTIYWNLKSLCSGTYLLRLSQDNLSIVNKLTIID